MPHGSSASLLVTPRPLSGGPFCPSTFPSVRLVAVLRTSPANDGLDSLFQVVEDHYQHVSRARDMRRRTLYRAPAMSNWCLRLVRIELVLGNADRC